MACIFHDLTGTLSVPIHLDINPSTPLERVEAPGELLSIYACWWH